MLVFLRLCGFTVLRFYGGLSFVVELSCCLVVLLIEIDSIVICCLVVWSFSGLVDRNRLHCEDKQQDN